MSVPRQALLGFLLPTESLRQAETLDPGPHMTASLVQLTDCWAPLTKMGIGEPPLVWPFPTSEDSSLRHGFSPLEQALISDNPRVSWRLSTPWTLDLWVMTHWPVSAFSINHLGTPGTLRIADPWLFSASLVGTVSLSRPPSAQAFKSF